MKLYSRTGRTRNTRPLGALLVLALGGTGACSPERTPDVAVASQAVNQAVDQAAQPEPQPRAAEPGAAATLARPTLAYVAPQPWHSRTDPSQVVAAPDPAQESWRAFVHQYAPMQAETPRWTPLPATENVVLQMRPDSRFRCLVTPLSVEAESDDFGSQLQAWVLGRELRCSSDDWRTWSAYPQRVRVQPNGAREMLSVRALLRERPEHADDGATRETLVLLRDEPEQREASKGPPQILAGMRPDDD